MLAELPAIVASRWLSDLTATSIEWEPLPLIQLLEDSLYYPSSGLDGDPIKYMAGNILSFIYADYSLPKNSVLKALTGAGFRGYELLASRDVFKLAWELERQERDLRWLKDTDGSPSSHAWIRKDTEPFCIWSVFQRQDNFPDTHGPLRFSLLYLCAEGVAAFQSLYIANSISPMAVAVIQPGHSFGGNWTDFTDPKKIFSRSVQQNPAGQPSILLCLYDEPCWPNYGRNVCFRGRRIGVWERTPG